MVPDPVPSTLGQRANQGDPPYRRWCGERCQITQFTLGIGFGAKRGTSAGAQVDTYTQPTEHPRLPIESPGLSIVPP